MDWKKNTTLNGLLYLLALAGTIHAQRSGIHALEYVCKPLLLIVLSSWFFFNSRRVGDRFTLLIQAGLFFSLVGDTALMFTHLDDFNFIVGLGAFFLAQLCYAVAFIENVTGPSAFQGLFVSVLLTVGIGAFAFFFAWDLMPHVEADLELPVIAYIIALGLMGAAAAFRYRRTYPRSFWMVMVGALLFIGSDSILAWDRFRFPLSWSSFGILIPYAAAQALIAAGALAHVLDPDNLRRRQALVT